MRIRASVKGQKLVKQAMVNLGIKTYSELASRSNYQEKTVQRFLSDSGAGVSEVAASSICHVLGLTLEQVTGSAVLPIPVDPPIAIAFTDIVGSFQIQHSYGNTFGNTGDREYIDRILSPHRSTVDSLLVEHQGHSVKWTGDGYLAYFVTVDDAIRWAVAVQTSHTTEPIRTPNGNLQIRIGIHWGKCKTKNINNIPDLIGENVTLAQRIMSKGHGDQIVISDAVKLACGKESSIVRFYDHGLFALKGVGNQRIWEVLWGDRPPIFIGLDWVSASRLMLEQQIGRERELRRNITDMAAEVDLFVPPGLVQPKEKTTARKREDNPSPEAEMEMSQLKTEEITQRFEHQEFLEQVIGSWEKNLAIVGEPGAGKSTWLTAIAQYLVRQEEVVICLPLGSSVNSASKNMDQVVIERWLETAILTSGKKTDKSTEDILTELQDLGEPIWLLLDGVDEIPDASDPIRRAKDLLYDSWLGKNCRIILSCRLNVWQNNLYTLPNFNTFRTIDFNQDQVLDFVGQWFRSENVNQPQEGERLQARLRDASTRSERIAEQVRNPLRLAMVCQSWYFREGELPNTKADLYQAMRQNFYQWKRDRFPLTLERINALNKALSKVALRSIEIRQLISEDIAHKEMGEELFELSKTMGWLNQTHIDNNNQTKYYAFYHYSFKEFFAAEGVADWDFFCPRNHNGEPAKDEQGNPKSYRIFEPQWKEVILFWLGRDDISQEQKKAFLGVGQSTGLSKFIERGDGCGGFYELQVRLWQLRATAEVYNLGNEWQKYTQEHIFNAINDWVSENARDTAYSPNIQKDCNTSQFLLGALIEAHRPTVIRCLSDSLLKQDRSWKELVDTLADTRDSFPERWNQITQKLKQRRDKLAKILCDEELEFVCPETTFDAEIFKAERGIEIEMNQCLNQYLSVVKILSRVSPSNDNIIPSLTKIFQSSKIFRYDYNNNRSIKFEVVIILIKIANEYKEVNEKIANILREFFNECSLDEQEADLISYIIDNDYLTYIGNDPAINANCRRNLSEIHEICYLSQIPWWESNPTVMVSEPYRFHEQQDVLKLLKVIENAKENIHARTSAIIELRCKHSDHYKQKEAVQTLSHIVDYQYTWYLAEVATTQDSTFNYDRFNYDRFYAEVAQHLLQMSPDHENAVKIFCEIFFKYENYVYVDPYLIQEDMMSCGSDPAGEYYLDYLGYEMDYEKHRLAFDLFKSLVNFRISQIGEYISIKDLNKLSIYKLAHRSRSSYLDFYRACNGVGIAIPLNSQLDHLTLPNNCVKVIFPAPTLVENKTRFIKQIANRIFEQLCENEKKRGSVLTKDLLNLSPLNLNLKDEEDLQSLFQLWFNDFRHLENTHLILIFYDNEPTQPVDEIVSALGGNRVHIVWMCDTLSSFGTKTISPSQANWPDILQAWISEICINTGG